MRTTYCTLCHSPDLTLYPGAGAREAVVLFKACHTTHTHTHTHTNTHKHTQTHTHTNTNTNTHLPLTIMVLQLVTSERRTTS